MPIPDGAKYVKENKNRVSLPDGVVVTRHEAETLGAKEAGFSTLREYRDHVKNLKNSGRYQTFVADAKNMGMNRRTLIKHMARVNWADNRPNGSKAKFLVTIGRRPKGSDYVVGQSDGEEIGE